MINGLGDIIVSTISFLISCTSYIYLPGLKFLVSSGSNSTPRSVLLMRFWKSKRLSLVDCLTEKRIISSSLGIYSWPKRSFIDNSKNAESPEVI